MMYLHIGNGETVRVRDLVAFFDFDAMTVASISRRFLSDAEKKKIIDPDNHDGVITHLEPDILECEGRWALGSITMNKASGGVGMMSCFKS